MSRKRNVATVIAKIESYREKNPGATLTESLKRYKLSPAAYYKAKRDTSSPTSTDTAPSTKASKKSRKLTTKTVLHGVHSTPSKDSAYLIVSTPEVIAKILKEGFV